MLLCDRTFQGEYTFGPGQWPGGPADEIFWYPGASRLGGRDGILVAVEPTTRDRWLGVFAPKLRRGVDCAVALPDRRSLAVVSGGAAYRVSTEAPLEWDTISVGRVAAPVIVAELDLVLFLEHTRIIAYGRTGLAWESNRLVWDELEAVRVEHGVLQATGFDAPLDRQVPFTVDLRTGQSDDAPHTDRRLKRVR
jgi:hypothetical protein